MDVSVRDVDEIVRFGRSLNGFMTDYLGSLQQVSTGASSDYTKARNCLNSFVRRLKRPNGNSRWPNGILNLLKQEPVGDLKRTIPTGSSAKKRSLNRNKRYTSVPLGLWKRAKAS